MVHRDVDKSRQLSSGSQLCHQTNKAAAMLYCDLRHTLGRVFPSERTACETRALRTPRMDFCTCGEEGRAAGGTDSSHAQHLAPRSAQHHSAMQPNEWCGYITELVPGGTNANQRT